MLPASSTDMPRIGSHAYTLPSALQRVFFIPFFTSNTLFVRGKKKRPFLFFAHSWKTPESIQHDWTHMLEAKRKELTRLNNAYKNTLGSNKVKKG